MAEIRRKLFEFRVLHRFTCGGGGFFDLLESELRFGNGDRSFFRGGVNLLYCFVERKGVYLVEDGCEFYLELGEAGSKSRNHGVIPLIRQAFDFLVGIVIEIHIHRASEQASGL